MEADRNGTTSGRPSSSNVDGNVIRIIKKTLDANKYATKKTIAQGLLDVALLTANASQLKYILQVGEKHEFYTLMLTLIIISIILQLMVAILFVIIGGLNINKDKDHTVAIILNDMILIFVFLISLINIIISGFGMEYSNNALKLLSETEKVLQGILCVFLGTGVNINKENDQKQASWANNILLCLNVLSVAINVLISAFEMKENYGNISKDLPDDMKYTTPILPRINE